MGGYGSGRWGSHSIKCTVEDCLALNVDKLVRDRLLRGGLHSSGHLTWTVKSTGKQVSTCGCGYEFDGVEATKAWLRLIYTLSDTKEYVNYRLNLTTTKPRYGGIRWWMVCPLVKDARQCGRRVGRLFLPAGAKYFGCRHCYALTYTSCQESHIYDRAFADLARGFPGMTGEDIRKLLEGRW